MPSTDTEDKEIDARSSTALVSTQRNLRYLYDPKTAPNAVSSRRTRAFLRVVRSGLIFAFWRIVRYAKYVAIGSLVATVGAGAFGTLISGVGFVLAPTGIAGTIFAATGWGVGMFALRRLKRWWGKGRGYENEEEYEEQRERRSQQSGIWG